MNERPKTSDGQMTARVTRSARSPAPAPAQLHNRAARARPAAAAAAAAASNGGATAAQRGAKSGGRGVKVKKAKPDSATFMAARDWPAMEYQYATCWLRDGSHRGVLNVLVRTILSQNTTDATSSLAFASLRESFPTWESVRVGKPTKVAHSIKQGGLADIKTARIQVILNEIADNGWRDDDGDLSLEVMHEWSDERIKDYLGNFKGVGPKTVSCVLMFGMQRADLAVDTHVWKIAVALGWVSKSATREQAYDELNAIVPDPIKIELHVLLVEHGKRTKNDTRMLSAGIQRILSGESIVKEETKPGVFSDEDDKKRVKLSMGCADVADDNGEDGEGYRIVVKKEDTTAFEDFDIKPDIKVEVKPEMTPGSRKRRSSQR